MGLPRRYGWLQKRAGSIANPLPEMTHFPCNEGFAIAFCLRCLMTAF